MRDGWYEDTLTLHCPPGSSTVMSHVEVPSLYQEVEGILITRDREFRAKEAVEANLVALSFTTPSSHTCLCTLHTFTVSLSNTTKASRFNYLSLVFLWGSNIHKTKFVFLLLVCVMSMSLSGQPKNLEGKEGTRVGPCAC